MFCTNCGKASQASAKFCMDCGSEISRPIKESSTIASKAKKPNPTSVSQKRKPSTTKTSGATKASKKRKPSPKADSSGKWIFAAIATPLVLLVVYSFSVNFTEGNVSSPYQSPSNNSLEQAPTSSNQSDSSTAEVNQESSVDESSQESALKACIEYGSLAASAAGYDCPPSARTVKEALVNALAYYCDMPAQAALDKSSWTALNPFAEDGVFTLQSITAMGRTLWFTVDTRYSYGEVYADSLDAELYLEDWGCPLPGPYIVLKN